MVGDRQIITTSLEANVTHDAIAPPAPDLREQAIAALTALARGERVVAGHTEPDDFAGILAGVLAAVAANVGGTELLLFGRSGSWEADHVRNLLRGTVGSDDEGLPPHRTEPIHVDLDPGNELERVHGADWDRTWDELIRAADDALEAFTERLVQTGEAEPPVDEHVLTADPAYAAAHAAVDEVIARRDAAEAQYAAALLAAAQEHARTLGYLVPVVSAYPLPELSGDDRGFVEDMLRENIAAHARNAVTPPPLPTA